MGKKKGRSITEMGKEGKDRCLRLGKHRGDPWARQRGRKMEDGLEKRPP